MQMGEIKIASSMLLCGCECLDQRKMPVWVVALHSLVVLPAFQRYLLLPSSGVRTSSPTKHDWIVINLQAAVLKFLSNIKGLEKIGIILQ